MVFGWAEELGVGEILGEKMVAGTPCVLISLRSYYADCPV